MSLVVLLGSLTILTSRNERQAASNPLKSEKPRPPAPSKNFAGDHWHAALGIYICNDFVPDIQSDNDPNGIHTHNDGIVHIHPFTRASSGRRATFGRFADTVGLKVSDESIQVPGGKRYRNGDNCEDEKNEKGTIQVFLNGDERTGDPKKLRLRDRDQLVIAFAPEGAEIPKTPPSAGNLDNLTDVSPVSNPTASTVPGAADSTVPGDTTATSAPPGTDTTSATTAAGTAGTTTATTAAASPPSSSP